MHSLQVCSFYRSSIFVDTGLLTATTFFHLPVDEEEDKAIAEYERKLLTWTSSKSSHDQSGQAQSQTEDSREQTKIVNAILEKDDLYEVLDIRKSKAVDRLALRRAYLLRSRACHPEFVLSFISSPESQTFSYPVSFPWTKPRPL
jgi:hypothetical protein